MMQPRARLLVVFVVGFTYLVMAGAFIFSWLDRSFDLPTGYGPEYAVVYLGGLAVPPIVGGLIAVKQPRNPYGWIWLVLGFALILTNFVQAYAIHGLLVNRGSLIMTGLVINIGAFGWFIGVATLPLLLILFPTGRLPSSRWRLLVWAVGAAVVIGTAVGWAAPGEARIGLVNNPYTLDGLAGQVAVLFAKIAEFVIIAALFLSVISLVTRYRRATGLVRQQFKWFAFGAVFFSLFVISDFFIELPGIWESVKASISFAVLPIAVGLAILRFRLYDIDLIIRRTLIYGALTGLLALVYFGSVLLLQSLFESLSGQGSPVALVISTLFIAALFAPLRKWVQDFTDRRFFRKKYNAQRVMDEFSRSARDEVSLEALTAELTRVVQETMQPEQVSIWLKKGGIANR